MIPEIAASANLSWKCRWVLIRLDHRCSSFCTFLEYIGRRRSFTAMRLNSSVVLAGAFAFGLGIGLCLGLVLLAFTAVVNGGRFW